MKKYSLLLLLAALATGAMAQEKKEYSSISKSISDDGKKLDIKVSFKAKGEKTQQYENTFDISGLNKVEKEALVSRVMDSLGIPHNTPATPRPPEPPKAPQAPAAPRAPKQKRFAAIQTLPVNQPYHQYHA